MATHINIMVDLKACVLNTATSYAYGWEYITCIQAWYGNFDPGPFSTRS